MRTAVILAGLMLASCGGPAIECASDGYIVVPEGLDLHNRSDWTNRNLQLSTDRLNKVTGSEQGKWLTAESLEKAKGCP